MRPGPLLSRLVLLALLLWGCSPPSIRGDGATGSSTATTPGQSSASPKRLPAAFMGEVIGMNGRSRGTGPSIGTEPLEELVNNALVITEGSGSQRTALAE